MERFFRTTKPVGTEVPRGAAPGGKWVKEFGTVQGTIGRHKVFKGYRYILPASGDGPEPFEGIEGLYPRPESIPVISGADAQSRWENEKDADGVGVG